MAELLAGAGARRMLLLVGEAGIGKTTLWEAGVADAAASDWRVLVARPGAAEEGLGFSALGDLLDGIGAESLAELPPPQRQALEVALLRAEPEGPPPQPRTIAVATLGLLRALAAERPVLIAIDDVQWLDEPSAAALGFVARRLEREPVAFLVSRRPGRRSSLEGEVRAEVERLDLGPLSLGATRRLLFERLGLTLSRRTVRRVHELSVGNPLFVLELGHLLRRRGVVEAEPGMPLPERIEELLGARVAELPEAARRALLAVALDPDLSRDQLAGLVGPEGLDAAFDGEVLLEREGRVVAAHPLLAGVAAAGASPGEARRVHAELAGTVDGGEQRARHLALAGSRPDPELAATIAEAAASARARGATEGAAELAEHALRLTPPDDPERGERAVALADHLLLAGRARAATRLLVDQISTLPAGPVRARARLLLAEGDEIASVEDVESHIEAALEEGRGDPEVEPIALARQAEYAAIGSVRQIADAARRAERAVGTAVGVDAARVALNALGWTRVLRGLPVDDLCRRFDDLAPGAFHLADSPRRLLALRHLWRGEPAPARAILGELLALAEERAEPLSYVMVRTHCCELALRAGEWDEAARLLEEWGMDADRELVVAPAYERCRGLLAAGRGDHEAVEAWAARTMAAAEASGVDWEMFEAGRARGTAALLRGRPEAAVEHLAPIWRRTAGEGVEDPGAFPVAPDLVEALLAAGERDAALAVVEVLRGLGEAQAHPWALAGAERCEALLALAAPTYDGAAAARLEAAADAYRRLGLRFDAARSLLSLGRAQRRRRQWRAARGSLGAAAAAFEELGSPGWADAARLALEGIGGRRPRSATELTPAERRTAELAARGLSNKEIAQASFVTVRTVESHLTRAYEKLGIDSRARLATRLAEPE